LHCRMASHGREYVHAIYTTNSRTKSGAKGPVPIGSATRAISPEVKHLLPDGRHNSSTQLCSESSRSHKRIPLLPPLPGLVSVKSIHDIEGRRELPATLDSSLQTEPGLRSLVVKCSFAGGAESFAPVLRRSVR
jgi:hypothetical protein